VQKRWIGKTLIVVAAPVLALTMAIYSFSQNAPAAGGGGQRQGGGGAAAGAGTGAGAAGGQRQGGGGGAGRGGGRGGNAAPAEPTPRLADGTVNLGRTATDVDGAWSLQYIQNMADRVPNRPAAGGGGRGAGAAGGGGGARGRGGAASEPWIPFLPWSAAVYNYNSKNESKYDPEGYCLPPGGPRLFATPYPMVVLQMPETKRIYMNFEGGTHVWREIYMDGRAHPAKDKLQGATWLGHSVGHWEGDTLVVDVTNFNEGTWLDYFGHPHTEQMHIVERWTRPTKGTLHYEATIDDPGAYSAPWTVTWDTSWQTAQIDEYICQENNQYLNHLRDDFGRFIIDHGEEQAK